jgi:hypothetical protein
MQGGECVRGQTETSIPTAADLLPSWRRHLRTENKSPKTLASYLEFAEQLIAFFSERGMPTDIAGIHREHVDVWIEDLLNRRVPRVN